MTVLSVRDLSSSLDARGTQTQIVRGISFDLERNRTLALVGESGSGKSVTALSLMRLLPAERWTLGGSAVLQGRELLDLSHEEMRAVRGRDIAMIFQEPMVSLNPLMTIGDQIAEQIRVHRAVSRAQAVAMATALLERVRIAEAGRRARQYPHEFSGGMLQRVMIAMALSCDPQVLIADEPTTALDVNVQAQILRLLQDVQRERGMSILLITHDLGVVAAMADAVAVMYAGRVVEYGDADDIFERPAHPYTQGLLAMTPDISEGRLKFPPRLKEIRGFVPRPEDLPPGCSFAPRCPVATDACRAAVPPLVALEGGARLAACIKAGAMAA